MTAKKKEPKRTDQELLDEARGVGVYMQLRSLYNRRQRGKEFKKVSSAELRKDDHEVLSFGYSDHTLARVYPDDTVELFLESYKGRSNPVWLARNRLCVHTFTKTDRKSDVRWWVLDLSCAPIIDGYSFRYVYTGRDKCKPVPCRDGTRIRHGVVLNPTSTIQRSKVNRQASKPILDTIKDWEKFAKSVFAIADEGYFKAGCLADVAPYSPELGEEPTYENMLGLIMEYGTTRAHGGLRDSKSWWATRSGWSARKELELAFRAAFNKWKLSLYEAHGVYEWVDVPLDKAA